MTQSSNKNFSSLVFVLLLAAVGCSTPNTPATPVTPDPPKSVSIIGITANSLTVRWTRGATDNTADTIMLSIVNAGVVSMVGQTAFLSSASDTQATLKGLAPSQAYQLIIKGGGGESAPITTTTLAFVVDPPVNVMVNSRNSESVAVRWNRGATDVGPDTIVATPTGGGSRSGSPTVQVPVNPGDSAGVVTGLVYDQFYNFSVLGAGGTSAAITWSAADRLPINGAWRIYASPRNLPGLISGLIAGFTGPISLTGANAQNVDFVFAIDSQAGYPFLSICSPSVTSLTGISQGRRTSMSTTAPYVKGGLDAEWFHQNDLTASIPAGAGSAINVVSLDTLNNGASMVFSFLTADNHYGRLEVVPQLNGRLWGATSFGGQLDFFIDVRVSYQSLGGFGFARRGLPTHSGNDERNVAHH